MCPYWVFRSVWGAAFFASKSKSSAYCVPTERPQQGFLIDWPIVMRAFPKVLR
jgi:hypothetical protein